MTFFLKGFITTIIKAIIKSETRCDLKLLIPTQVQKLLLLFLHELVTRVYTSWSTDMECGQRIFPGDI